MQKVVEIIQIYCYNRRKYTWIKLGLIERRERNSLYCVLFLLKIIWKESERGLGNVNVARGG